MKKLNQIPFVGKLFVLITLCFNLSSCIDCCDHDSVVLPNLEITEPIFKPEIHPVQIGNMIFEYNTDFSIALLGDGPYAKATYNPFEITSFYEDEYESDISKVSNVHFNSMGKITYMDSEFSYFYNSIDNYELKQTCHTSLEYNSEGRLIGFSGKFVITDFDYTLNTFDTSNGTFNADCQWLNGKLQKVTINTETDTQNYTTTYTFEYSNIKNELQQYITTIYEWEMSESLFDNDDIGGIINLKLLGNPSEYFVSKITYNSVGHDTEDSWNDTETASYSYTFNNDKTLKSYTEVWTEIYEGEEYSYSDTFDCVFTDDYNVKPNIQDNTRASLREKKNSRKSRLFKRIRN